MPANSSNGRAIAALLASNAVFLASDSFVKSLTATMAPGQMMAVRALICVPFFLAITIYSGNWRRWRALGNRAVMIRALSEGGISVLYITGLSQLPIANATAIFQTLPLAITATAAILMGERVGASRWAAVAIGFLGAMLIVKPGADGFNAAAAFTFGSVLVAVLRDFITKKVPSDIPLEMVSVCTSIGVGLCGAALGVTEEWHAVSQPEFLKLLGTGTLVSIGWLLLVFATKTGELSVIAPFRYTMLIWAVISSVVVFGVWPDVWAFAGMAVITASGIFILGDERRRAMARRAELDKLTAEEQVAA